jgi:hypothetical protein
MAAAAEFPGGAEIERDRLGMADMQIAVGLGRKARDDPGMPSGVKIGLHDVANEIAPCPAAAVATCGHAVIPPNPMRLPAGFDPVCTLIREVKCLKDAYCATGDGLVGAGSLT